MDLDFSRICLIATLAILVCGCSAADKSSDSASLPLPTITANFNDLLNLSGPGQVTYRWQREDGEPGRVVARYNGDMQRWDTIKRDSVSPTQGDFNIWRKDHGVHQLYGCLWFSDRDDRRQVFADCGEGGATPGMDALIGMARIQGLVDRRLPDRVILGRSTACYEVPPLAEICLDSAGLPLYLSIKSREDSSIFEATRISDNVERVDWLLADPELADVDGETPMPSAAFQFPAEFNLN